ncbi:trimeric intracellular cation channel type B [Spea bombifrons]|uniref:trimeric intracellular cation channel type B n=1 Tax=Spea bombifrons TaxID=233779 RepID=UPI00234B6220|nr:trimeric intracellular cation channel type B [Spea bombifrons]
MESLSEMSLQFSQLSMFPIFDGAHYLASVMAAREQPGAVEVSRRSPMACWFSAMLHCFGGGILSSLMLAEPPILFLSNGTNILLASVIWYLVYYFPSDLFYNCTSFLPLKVIIAALKEVTRTWKILSGVTHAHSHFKDAWLVMIAIGWTKAAGGGLISNFEQLVRGVWKPESNELLKMSYPVKISLVGAVLFTLQHGQYLPISRNDLMLFYTMFLIVTKVTMMLTRSSTSPFQPIETPLGRLLFGCPCDPTEVKEKVAASPDVKAKLSRQPEEKNSTNENIRKRPTKKAD